MKSDTLILCSILFSLNIAFFMSEPVKNRAHFMDLKNNKTCREKFFSLDEGYKSNYAIRKNKMRSNEVLDCFGIGKLFSRPLDWFLKKDANGTKALKIKIYASTRNLLDKFEINYYEKFEASVADFDIRRRTFFIVHGFLADGNEKWIDDMRRALLKWDDVNVFIIDWRDGSNTWNYYKAAVNTRTVGDQISTFIGRLIEASSQSKQIDMDPNSFGSLHFIGHSLGSHICGYAAQEIRKRRHKWTVQRITGLDPAQPCFKKSNEKLRLDQNDAPYVDIIHTNGRILTKLGLGLPFPIGHIDFYPNGGKVQPGCALSSSSLWKYLPLPISTIAQTICSHGRSYLYFIESILSAIKQSCAFWAHEWDLSYDKVDSILNINCTDKKCVEMGINAEKYSHKGIFFTITARSQPFCQITKESKEEVKEIIERVRRKNDCELEAQSRDDVLVIYD